MIFGPRPYLAWNNRRRDLFRMKAEPRPARHELFSDGCHGNLAGCPACNCDSLHCVDRGYRCVWIVGTAAFAATVNRRHPPIGKVVECNGVRLHFVEPGLVFLHGNGMMNQDFETSGLLDRAARSYHVLCFDRPGFGHSTRPRRRIWTPEA